MNPLVASGRSLRLEMSPAEHRVALILGLGVLFANWVWVLRVQG